MSLKNIQMIYMMKQMEVRICEKNEFLNDKLINPVNNIILSSIELLFEETNTILI